MNVYTYIFLIGLINLIVPFLGISFVYKQYIIVSVAVFTLVYALLVRARIKEKEHFIEEREHVNKISIQKTSEDSKEKTIEEIIEMQEETQKRISDVLPKKTGRKLKVLVNTSKQHDE